MNYLKTMKETTSRNSYRKSDFILHITANSHGAVQGKIEHCQSGQSQYFRSFIELTELINHKLDQTQFPQATTEQRQWPDDVISLSGKGVK